MRRWLALLALCLAGCIMLPRERMPRLANASPSEGLRQLRCAASGCPVPRPRPRPREQAVALQRALHSSSRSRPVRDRAARRHRHGRARVERPLPPRLVQAEDHHRPLPALQPGRDPLGTVTQERFYPPQLLSLQVDLVSADTGLVIWTGKVDLDASDERVLQGLRIYYGIEEDDETWRVALLSPERFARFAAFQIACLL